MKSKFTHEERQAILDRYISKSESPTSSIKSVGVSKSTFYKWLSDYRSEQAGAERSEVEPVGRCEASGSIMNYIVFRSRSRFAPSLWSGSTTKTSHCDIFSAQDDTNGRINEKIGRFSCENQFYRLLLPHITLMLSQICI